MRFTHLDLLVIQLTNCLLASLGADILNNTCGNDPAGGSIGACIDENNLLDLHNDSIPETENFECGIYLAASSIPNAGFGIYTTRFIAEDDRVQPYPEAPSIIVNDFETENEEQDWNHVDYVWEPDGMSAYEANEVHESVMTFGSLCNYHPILKNLEPVASDYDDTILNRFKDPGAGAISYYSGRHFVASRDINAGEELFDEYGDSWLDQRPGTYADFVPREEDYQKVANVFSQLNEAFQDKEQQRISSDRQVAIIADTVSNFISDRASSLLPRTKSSLDAYTREIRDKNISGDEMKSFIARKNLLKHDISWIKSNGICMEKIRPGSSTVDGAGRGAFAQIIVKQSDIISPAPLLNIPSINSLKTHVVMIDGKRKQHYQLLLNYCFGNSQSDLILCPQTNVILVNHCSTRREEFQCSDGKGPNARMQWAGAWDPSTNVWLGKSIEEIKKLTAEGSRGLSLELVATRDIMPGEEIFIDYGAAWEDAWLSHVKSWTPYPSNNYTFTPLSQMSKDDFRTNEELKMNRYPDNIELFCYGGRFIDFKLGKDEVDTGIVDGSEGFNCTPDDLNYDKESLFSCDVLEKNDELQEYTVGIVHEGIKFAVKRFPKSSIVMKVKRYSSDQFLRNAFRHFIGIDDDLFPTHWKRVQ